MTTYEPPPDDTLFREAEAEGDWYAAHGDDYDPNPKVGPPVHDPGVRATLKLALAIDRLAAAIESTGNSRSPAPTPPVVPSAPQGYGAPPAPRGPDPVKMGKKVYAICRAQNQDVQEIGQRILGKSVTPNSQQWSVDDLKMVLDTMKAWGWDNR